MLRPGIGTLQADLSLPEPVKKRELDFDMGGFAEQICFTQFHARQFPLRDGHLLQIELFRPGPRAPFRLQILAKMLKFLVIFARQNNSAGTKPMAEGVEANRGLSLRSSGAGKLRPVALVRFDLLE
jgi:hypothetical protein